MKSSCFDSLSKDKAGAKNKFILLKHCLLCFTILGSLILCLCCLIVTEQRFRIFFLCLGHCFLNDPCLQYSNQSCKQEANG
ncbi:unnamed protein product [Larinioides sclopetarius]|uniref:Uncharacterized protein n=1 Tax=Larinioides sclopetarius TaxID=280406 RepID=A0AAV1ZSP5_9ARAC